MSTAALVNARASNGSTVQTAQLHQQQQSFNGRSTSIGLSSKKSDENSTVEYERTDSSSSRPSSIPQQLRDQDKTASGEGKRSKTVSNNLPSAGNDDSNKMYPDELRNILIEVSRTGNSSILQWTESSESQAPSQDPNVARRTLAVSSGAAGPPRKKQRNGLYHLTSRTGMKRPLSARPGASYHQSPAHSSRTSGSELEDLSQYDSEGTVNSELSMDRARAQQLLNGVLNGINQKQSNGCKTAEETKKPQIKYKSLREVFRIATGAVLDHFFEKQGGYKLSPAEKRRNSTLVSANQKDGEKSEGEANGNTEAYTAELVFRQRKQRLLNLLSDSKERNAGTHDPYAHLLGPPFTIQRVAEVLLTPERYYTQTHKLCNCLEKLLLVTSSIRAFGGSTGGNSSQSRREEQEIAALADERGRLLSEYRRRRMQRAMSQSLEVDGHGEYLDRHQAPSSPPKALHAEGKTRKAADDRENEDGGVSDTSKEDLEKEELLEAARASLRSKFDHVGIDPHSAAANVNREHQAIGGNRSMTNSPPPPNYSGAGPGISLAGHGHGGLLRSHSHEEHQGSSTSSLVVRTPSPIMFKSAADGASSPKKASPTPVHPTHQNLQLLQMHHAAALAGVSPFDLMNLNGGGNSSGPHATGIGTLSIHPSSAMMPHLKEMDVESRSSASSDVDSESDDVSLDDSASDRSDSSDSNEPTTNSAAARALALNRVQQQQQQQQHQSRRMLGSTASSAFSSNVGLKASLQPSPQHMTNNDTSTATGIATSSGRQPEAEYQSGDSVDSLRADDSDSSSDMADN